MMICTWVITVALFSQTTLKSETLLLLLCIMVFTPLVCFVIYRFILSIRHAIESEKAELKRR